MLLLIFISCTGKQNNAYVQEQQIKVIPPRLSSSSSIIDSTVTITANLRLDGVRIFYTTDGSEPTQESTTYTKPIVVNREGTYGFKAFHPSWKASDVSTLTLYKKGYTVSSFDWEYTGSDSYPGLGPTTLNNHEKAPLNFRDPQWMGFNSMASATIRFEEKTHIESMHIGYFVDQNSWIFPPAGITLFIPDSDSIHIDIESLKKIDSVHIEDLRIPIGKELSSLNVVVYNATLPEWHPGSGNKGWVFMDEWIFN